MEKSLSLVSNTRDATSIDETLDPDDEETKKLKAKQESKEFQRAKEMIANSAEKDRI